MSGDSGHMVGTSTCTQHAPATGGVKVQHIIQYTAFYSIYIAFEKCNIAHDSYVPP